MKNILKITVLFFALISVGCKKYLNQQPITSVTSTTVFADEQGAYEALIAAYSRITGDQGYGKCLSLYYNIDNDETQGPSGTPNGERRSIARYLLDPTNSELSAPFNQLFQGIEYANVCIDQIPQMALYNNGTALQKLRLQRMVGEALTLRAQFYFDAVKIWGDLPLHFQPAIKQASQNPFPSRVNRDTIYTQILADLAIASTLIPWQNDMPSIGCNKDERISKATAKALRARIALFMGGYSLRGNSGATSLGTMQRRSDYLTYYQIAKQECADIIANGGHSLNPSYKNLWKEQVGKRVVIDPNNELIFQATAIGATSVEDTKLGYYNGPKLDGQGNASYVMLPTYFYAFDSMDLRRDVTFAPYNSTSSLVKTGVSITAMNDGKYRRDWMTVPANGNAALQFNGAKYQIIRYADVLLMYAEAENELNGPTASAYDAINQVRRRGFGKPVTTPDASIDLSGLNKTDFFTALVKERSFELGGEGVRKYDLIRWNLLASKIAETQAKLLAMSNKTAPYDVLPTSMYLITGTTADDATMWANSFYQPQPSGTPPGTTKITWIGSGVNGTNLARFATGFTTGKSELFPIPQPAITANPYLTQNPGY